MKVGTALIWLAGCGFNVGSVPDDASIPDMADAAADELPDAPPDTLDAGFDPSACPVAYDVSIPQAPLSRYRLVSTLATFRLQYADCLDDGPGLTHLAVFGTAQEQAALEAIRPAAYVYVGALQSKNETVPSQSWRWLDGSQVNGGWAASPRVQPEDGDYVENNAENITLLAGGGLHDETGVRPYTAICECDGVAVDVGVAALVP